MRDLNTELKATVGLAPLLRTAASSAVIDRQGYETLLFLIHIGAATDGTFAWTLQESDAAGSGFAACDAADMIGDAFSAEVDESPNATSAAGIHKLGYRGNKRYVKAVATVTGSPGTGHNVAITVLQSRGPTPQAASS